LLEHAFLHDVGDDPDSRVLRDGGLHLGAGRHRIEARGNLAPSFRRAGQVERVAGRRRNLQVGGAMSAKGDGSFRVTALSSRVYWDSIALRAAARSPA
jgi:hypothetical protein